MRGAACLLVGGALSWELAMAATIEVSSLAELERAVSDASPGDRIVLSDGIYSSEKIVAIRCAGTAEAPIVIEAETVGGVEIRGTDGFTLEPPAAYTVISGFRFTHDAGTMRLPAGVHHCRLTRNVFQLAVPKGERAAFVIVAGDDHEIDHNAFLHKATEGQMLYVNGPGTVEMAQRTWIHHNYFDDFEPTANNCSALHIGHSARSLTPAHAVVEYNLFVQCRGENEGAICNKSCDNIYRYNTFGEGSTELSLRHGNRCLVYANYFIGSTGIRFFGDEHRIFSNYFARCRPAIAIGNGGANVPPADLKSHDRPDGVHVVFNTLVNNRRNVQMSRRRGGLGAEDLVFEHNLIIGGNAAVSIEGPLPGVAWEGNGVWNNDGGPGDIPESGFTLLNPGLSADAVGIFRPTAERAVLERTSSNFDYLTVDLDGQARSSATEAGADERSDRPVVNRVLTAKDVGPGGPEEERPLLSAPKLR